MTPDHLPDAFRTLLFSDRVSHRTRAVLLARMAEPDGPPALDPARAVALRALLARVLPQDGDAIDLLARVYAGLATGDGWRTATQPPDLQAYRAGLDALDRAARCGAGVTFAGLPPERQDGLLRRLAAGAPLPGAPGALSPPQLQAWFEDVRADAARAYVSHPLALARMGYSGIGYGGDTERLPGFRALGPGEREAWEPEAAQ